MEKSFVRPILNMRYVSLGMELTWADFKRSTSHKIIGGRHPMVEDGLWDTGRGFTANDCLVGEPERLWIITGYFPFGFERVHS